MVKTKFLVSIIRFLLLVCFSFSCKEPFPNYDTPQQVLSARVIFQAPDTIEVAYDGLSLQYYLNSVLALKVEVTNEHDDLLQGKALIRGRIVLQSFAQTSRTFVVPLTSGNLRSPTLFQGNIALGPARKAEFSELWLPYGTDGKIAFDGLPFRVEGGAELYGSITFIASAEVQIFERVQATRSTEISFSRVFRLLRQ